MPRTSGDSRIQNPTVAHTRALEEEAARQVARDYAHEHPELISGFIASVLMDDRYGVEIARRAVTLLERRAAVQKREFF
jgi:hypothetical protein